MDYQTFPPSSDLSAIINCYWTLQVPASDDPQRQRIIPDGMLEMAFVLGDDIKRFVTENRYVLQPRAMVLGHTMEPFYIEPTGYVDTFAIRFYPHGFAHFIPTPIDQLINKETPLDTLFGESVATELATAIIEAAGVTERITVIENFLLARLQQQVTIDTIVSNTITMLMASQGNASITHMVDGDSSRRRQLERKFLKQIGISPKQLGKVIRLQHALKLMLAPDQQSLTDIACQSEYYDQAHFIKDFREFTGVSPREFLGHDTMQLSSVMYR